MFPLFHACQNPSVVPGSFRFMEAETKKNSTTSGLPEQIYWSSFFLQLYIFIEADESLAYTWRISDHIQASRDRVIQQRSQKQL